MSRLLLAVLLSASLSGCATVNPVTLAKAAQIDPLSADPALFTVYLDLPEGLAIAPGGAVLSVSTTFATTGEAESGSFPLVARDVGGMRAWTVAPDDLDRLRALQAQARDWEALDAKASSGSIALGITGCTTGAGPDPKARISADLDLDGTGARLPLIRGLTVARLLEETGGAATPACPDDTNR